MNKRLVDEYNEFFYQGEKTPLTLGTLAVVVFCTVFLIVATFTKIDISHWWLARLHGELTWNLKQYYIVPQTPVVIMTSAILGARFGVLVILFYLIIGLFVWPVFGFGGGPDYIISNFFGYILGFFAAIIISGKILSDKFTIKNVILAAITGVFSIHLCGILYSFILSLLKSSFYNPDFHSIFTQIIYDVIFSIIAILISRPVKFVLWIAMKREKKKSRKKITVKQASSQENLAQ